MIGQTGQGGFLQTRASEGRPYQFLGAPYDGGASCRPGARFGPDAIRRASRLLCDGPHPLFDADPRALVSEGGDLCKPSGAAPRALRDIELGVGWCKAVPLLAGGDHAVTLPALKGFRQMVGAPIGVVHVDAHCDTWEDNFTAPSGHATWVREAVEQGVVEAVNVVSLGMRGPVDRATRDWLAARGGRSFPLDRVGEVTWPLLDRALPIWLTVDIDALDPAHAPGTGTPEVGGMTSRELLSLVRSVALHHDVRGMDVVEVSPPYDHAEITALAAATVMWEFVAAREARQNGEPAPA